MVHGTCYMVRVVPKVVPKCGIEGVIEIHIPIHIIIQKGLQYAREWWCIKMAYGVGLNYTYSQILNALKTKVSILAPFPPPQCREAQSVMVNS